MTDVLFNSLIGNEVHNPECRYAAILGANPSAGARSPVLWNAAFEAHGLQMEMVPLDVTPENLVPLLEALNRDERFVGGAVAVPHKEAIATWLGSRLSIEAMSIGAVNCLFRGPDGHLAGTNTDGEGAVESIVSAFGPLDEMQILQIGCGGAGKSVASYVASRLADRTQLRVANRNGEEAETFSRQIGARPVAWPVNAEELTKIDLLINATNVGAGDLAAFVSLSQSSDESVNQQHARDLLAVMPAKAAVFDVVYDPHPTMLLSLADARGLRTLNGRGMNLVQAVLGFGHSMGMAYPYDLTEKVMRETANSL